MFMQSNILDAFNASNFFCCNTNLILYSRKSFVYLTEFEFFTINFYINHF